MKKTLSIILAILMIVTTVPFAFAAEENVIDLSMLTEIYVISDSGEYTFTGSGSYGIKVESGNPTIVLNNASITVGEGSAIDIASGSTTTIFVMGDNTIDTDSMWEKAGGIFVAEGGTVNITSNGTDNILRAHGTLAAAIGGKYDYDNNESYNAGSISISNVTVYAYTNNFHAAAIGAAGEGTCGTINITNAVVYAYGAGDRWTSAPGIGSAWSLVSWSETIPVVIISDSEVHTFRHNSGSDYIGYLGDVEIPMNATGSINCGEGGSITNSTIYCYTGLDSTTTDKTVKYGTLGGLLKEDGTCEDNCEGGSATCSVLAICENCGTSYGEFDANKHTLVQKDAKAPTCTEIGWDAYEYCTACNYTTYVEIPENGHTPLDAVRENEVAPKCDVAGSYDLVVYCDDCGAELDRDTVAVDALKHSFTKYETTEEAKCGVEGKEVAYCDNGCGETDEKAIEALKHDIVIDEAVAPKCGETGLTQGEHCTRCDYKVEQEAVPALTHKDADGDYKCDNGCGHEFEKPAPEEPTPDTPDEPEDETCADCGKVHTNFFSEIICFFTRIINFIKNLFA